jgi:hypothetical protein
MFEKGNTPSGVESDTTQSKAPTSSPKQPSNNFLIFSQTIESNRVDRWFVWVPIGIHQHNPLYGDTVPAKNVPPIHVTDHPLPALL